MSTTAGVKKPSVYTVKRVEKDKTKHRVTAIAIKKTANGSSSNGDSSVWLRKGNNHGPLKVGAQTIAPQRKRNRRKQRPRNNTSNGIADRVVAPDDNCSSLPSMSPSCSPPHSASPSGSRSNSNELEKNNKTPSAPSYDPSSNPYSLENYKRDPELQITLESQVVKETAKTQLMHSTEPGATTLVPLTPLFPSPKTQQVTSALDLNAVPLPPTFTPHSRSAQTTPRSAAAASFQRLNQTQNANHPPRRQLYGNGSHAPRHYQGHNKRSMHHIPLRSFSLQDHLALQDSSHCPHGDLTPERLINIKIRKRNVCYVVGLPIHVATEERLRAQEWFGQFGTIATIAINRNQKSTLANSIPAHITYDNNISALNAINFCNKFVFDDGRKLKATFGTQHYCRWFISINKKCTNVYCGFRHSWCRADDIITAKDIADFKGICPLLQYLSMDILMKI